VVTRNEFMLELYKSVQSFETRWNRGQCSDTPGHWPDELESEEEWQEFEQGNEEL